jgi:predicted ATPase/transcriptional regulator with XRE-family HTH domain
MSDQQTSFGILLKRYRMAAGLTQEALAARAGLSPRTIADLERGINRTPRHDTFELLLTTLGLTVQQRALLVATVRPGRTATVNGSRAPSRIPLPPTPLIGREQEMARAVHFLQQDRVRLLTLTGPAGVGKTRLALQIAGELGQQFAEGALFVALAALRDAALVPVAIGEALGLHAWAEGELSQQLTLFLQEKQLLLVLDNFEHLLEAAPFVADLLSRCPHLSVLVTSRVPLHLRAEQVLRLSPLPLADAIKLFQERALAMRPGGVYAEHQVAAICERLDRLPLAIELAAMHVNTFSLPELSDRLTHRLALLREGPRDLPARQQTMEAAMAWSYDLLSEQEQQCFRALGVFVGGWTLEAAEAVCRAREEQTPEETILALAALVDASLVQADIPLDGPARFGMLELMRDYALERLRAAGEEELYRRRHAAYYAQLAERASSGIPGQRVPDALLLQDVPNVRAAIGWAIEHQEVAVGLQLARFCLGSWWSQGRISEAEGILERLLRLGWQSGAPSDLCGRRALVLHAFGQSLLVRGKTAQAQAVAREALSRAQRSEDHCGICSALALLGQIAQQGGNLDEAEACFEKSDEHARLGGDPDLQGNSLRNLAELARMRGDLVRATLLYEEALALARAKGMAFHAALITTLLGHLASGQHNYALAKAHYRESLVVFRSFDSPTFLAWCLEGLAAALNAERQYAQAARVCAAAVTMRKRVQTPLPPAERAAFEQTIAIAQTALGEPAWASEWTTGSELTQDQAIDYALSDACT